MDITQPRTTTSTLTRTGAGTGTRTPRRSARAAFVGLALAVGALSLTACGPVDTLRGAVSDAARSAEVAQQSQAPTDTPTDTGSETTTESTDGTTAAGQGTSTEQDGGEGLSAKGLCQVLRDTQPALDMAGGEGLAQIILVGELTNAYEEHGATALPKDGTLDDLAASCPSDRDAAYEATGLTSFDAL